MRRLKDNLASLAIEDEHIVVDPDTGNYFVANPVANAMLEALAEHGDEESALAALVSGLDADEATIRADFAAFQQQLRSLGLIEELVG